MKVLNRIARLFSAETPARSRARRANQAHPRVEQLDQRIVPAVTFASYGNGTVQVRRDAAEPVLLPRQKVWCLDVTVPNAVGTAGVVVGFALGMSTLLGLTLYVLSHIVVGP